MEKFDLGAAAPAEVAELPKNLGVVGDVSDVLSPPRLKLIQTTSKEFKTDRVAGEGQLWSTYHNAPIGGVYKIQAKSFEQERPLFIPLAVKKTYRHFDANQTFVFQTDDPQDPRVQAFRDVPADELADGEIARWHLRWIDFLIYGPINHDPKHFKPVEEMTPMLLQFGSTSYRHGRRLLNELHGQALCSWAIELFVDRNKNEKNEWWEMCGRKVMRLQNMEQVRAFVQILDESQHLLTAEATAEPAPF